MRQDQRPQRLRKYSLTDAVIDPANANPPSDRRIEQRGKSLVFLIWEDIHV